MIKKAMGGKPNPASIRSTNRERELNESKGGMANKTYHLEPTNTPHSP